jgi:DNA-binding CsgD family transcriptional regulator
VTADALPRVSGRHRNHVLAAERRSRALRLLSDGMTYQQVADQLGYANRGTVHRLVARSMAAQQVEDVARLRHLEASRLDALQVVVWDAAIAGDLTAVRVATNIIKTRIKLLGLALDREAQLTRADNCSGLNTVVVSNEDCRRTGCDLHGSLA